MADISAVKEFAIGTSIKYVREAVRIDRSQNSIDRLTSSRDPEWENKQLFLKVMIEGHASLYSYQEEELEVRFFYKTGDSGVEQLIHRKYLKGDGIATNNDFRQQLWAAVNCDDEARKAVFSLPYNRSSLVKYFKDYNECKGTIPVAYKSEQAGSTFNLRIIPGLDYTTLTVWNFRNSAYGVQTFDASLSFRGGLQGEFVLPFNKGKWAIIAEASYQGFSCVKKTYSVVTGDAEVKYQAIETPVGVRYYMFLRPRGRIFADVFAVTDFAYNSYLRFENDPYVKSLNAGIGIAGGIGFDYKKFSSSFRFYANRYLFPNNSNWLSDYNRVSFIVGYKIF
ncbi:MAG TPA: hypothetical protein VF490_02540 [Chryseosolibacter sp.]